jgi:hypothetical protein
MLHVTKFPVTNAPCDVRENVGVNIFKRICMKKRGNFLLSYLRHFLSNFENSFSTVSHLVLINFTLPIYREIDNFRDTKSVDSQ